jgi:Trypsin-co-occurring domain 1
MLDAVEFTLDDGSTVAVAPLGKAGSSAVGLSEHLQAAGKTLRQALTPVTAAATEVIDGFRRLASQPDAVEISFGVTLDGKLGGIIASTTAGAHLQVKLRWHGPDLATSGSSG